MKPLRAYTMARVGLGRAGNALPIRELLDFRAAHAAARDAVHASIDAFGLRLECEHRGWSSIILHSAASDRTQYLRRPDLGRRLDEPSRALLAASPGPCDAVIAVADGLSALAVHRHAIPLLELLLPKLASSWTIAPLALVEQARVAIADEIGATTGASLSLILIGERPGLTSPDSLGAYLTWNPHPGRTDAQRNCLSNIRPEGLDYEDAAARLLALMNESRRLRLSGIALKERSLNPRQLSI